MTLNEYQHKRKFDVTSEPSGAGRVKPGHRYVIQKHAASRLHYDFRLEFDGVLKSWAVPHGPSLDPSVKSLAVQVEDHPIDYADFEGTIPQGQYGGGTVMVWDRGSWETDDDIAAGLKRGKLSFRLHGEKLQGEWTLVRMRGRGDENWLLLKKQDEAAISRKKYDILEAAPRSVLTGRDMSQIADNEKPIRKRKGEKPFEKAHGRRAASEPESSAASAPPKSAKKSSETAKGASSNGSAAQQAKSIAAHLRKSPAREMPKKFNPQLATLSDDVPTGDDWLHEVKLDGYRVLARIERGKVKLITRGGLDWTDRFSKIAEVLEELPVKNAMLDGEVVALDPKGASDFQRLQNWLAEDNQTSLVYYVFDVPYAEKHDLTDLPLVERKKILSQLVLNHWPDNDGPVRYHDHIVGSGEKVLKQACHFAMEGIVSKKANSPYVSRRSETWLKVKCVHNQEFVIAGYTKPSKSRIGFGALLLGYYKDKELMYCGRVGTGFTEVSLRDLTKRFERLETDKCPYAHPPRRDQQRGVTWLQPKLVAEISYGTRTSDGILRHAVFHGLREDKPATQVVLEKPVLHPKSDRNGYSTSRNGAASRHANNGHADHASRSKSEVQDLQVAGIAITHPERVVYPEKKLTKGDVVQYLGGIAPWMLPGIVGRPLTLVRCPGGPGKQCFFQKHLDEDRVLEGVEGVTVQEDKKEAVYPVIQDEVGLISMAQLNALEFHPWPARADDLEHPDFMVFDLDPGEGAQWSWVIEAARDVRDLLKKLSLESFVRTSGGKGLHVVAPFNRESGDWDRLKQFCSLVSHALAERYPDRYLAKISKAARRGKVFIDYLRNQRGATSVASYSPRARSGAGVATPLRWRDLDRLSAADEYTVENVLERVKRLRSDPWKDFFEIDQDLPNPSLAESKNKEPARPQKRAASQPKKTVKKSKKSST